MCFHIPKIFINFMVPNGENSPASSLNSHLSHGKLGPSSRAPGRSDEGAPPGGQLGDSGLCMETLVLLNPVIPALEQRHLPMCSSAWAGMSAAALLILLERERPGNCHALPHGGLFK